LVPRRSTPGGRTGIRTDHTRAVARIGNRARLTDHGDRELRAAVLDLAEVALTALSPAAGLRRSVALDGTDLIAGGRSYDLSAVRRLVLLGAGKASAELAMDQGTVDWAGIYTSDIQKTYINRDPAHNHYWFPPSDILMLFVNTAKYPFNQLAIRKALSLAIDRDKLSKIAESGYEPLASPTGLVLPNDQKFLASQYANLNFTMDVNGAQQQLESAGFTKGSDGIYADKNGKKLSMRLDVVTGFTDWISGAQIIAANLKALGIEVNVNTISQDDWQNNLNMGSFDISLCWTNPGPSPYFLYDALLRTTNSAPIGQTANSNYERWNDPAIDALLDKFAQTNDMATQQQAMAGIQQVMVEQLPSIPLLNEPYWYEYNTSSFVGWPDEQHLYAEPSPYSYPDNEMVLLHLQPAS